MSVETRTHLALIRWWSLACKAERLDERLLSHAANGGKRRLVEASIFKGMGVRAGHEDLFLAVPRGTAHGLYLELKAPDGRIQPEQKEMMAIHAAQGYAATVAWSFDEAVSAIVNYLRGGNPLKKP